MKSTLKLGSELRAEAQRDVLARYVHRYTKDHVPQWAKGTFHPVQFESDADWLANTRFWITSTGKLDARYSHCESHPTWPDNPELRRGVGA